VIQAPLRHTKGLESLAIVCIGFSIFMLCLLCAFLFYIDEFDLAFMAVLGMLPNCVFFGALWFFARRKRLVSYNAVTRWDNAIVQALGNDNG
jgi:predicted permease